MPEEWVNALFDDESLDTGARVALRERLRREWDAPGTDGADGDGALGRSPPRRRLFVSAAATAIVALSIGSLVWLANDDDAQLPASSVPDPTVAVTAAPTAPLVTVPPTSTVDDSPPPSEQRPDSPVVVPTRGGDPFRPEMLGTIPFGGDDGQVLEPAGRPLAVTFPGRLLLIETDPLGRATGKAVEVERSTGDVTRTVTLPSPSDAQKTAFYGSPNGVLYMSWPLSGAVDGLAWIAAVDRAGEYTIAAEGTSRPLESSDPTVPKLAVRVTGEGVLVGNDLVVESPLPAPRPAPRASWASDHLIEGSAVGIVEVALRNDEGYEETWLLNVRSDAVGVRGGESLQTHWLGAGVFAVVQRPDAQPFFVSFESGGSGAGYRSDGWVLAGSDGPGASFVRRTDAGIEVGSLTTMTDFAPTPATIESFVEVTRGLPVWRTIRLPEAGYGAYVTQSSDLVVGTIVGPIEELGRTTFGPEDVGALPDTPGSVTVVSALLNVAVGVDDKGRPSQVQVPIAFWAAALPPDFDRIQGDVLAQLNGSFPIGAQVAVLVTDGGEGRVVDTPKNGIIPSMAAITLVRGGDLINVDPTIDVEGMRCFDLPELRDYVAANAL